MQKSNHGLHELQNCTFMQAGCFGHYIYNIKYYNIMTFFLTYTRRQLCAILQFMQSMVSELVLYKDGNQ